MAINGDANKSYRGSFPCVRRLVTCLLSIVCTGEGQGAASFYHPLSAAIFYADEERPQNALRCVGDFGALP